MRERLHIADRFRRGFTLIELIAVMLLLSIMAAIVAPSLSGFAAGRRLNDTAVSMLALIDMGRAAAAGEGRVYRFNLDPVERRFWLTAQEGGAFAELGTDIGQKLTIPDDLAIEWVEPQGQADIGYLQITPVGEIDPSTIRITGRDVAELYLVSTTRTERYRVVSRDELPDGAVTIESAATRTGNTSGKSNSKNTGGLDLGTKSSGSSGGRATGDRSSGGY